MMQVGTGTAVAAIFGDYESARACRDALVRDGFSSPWLAVTKPAKGNETAERFGLIAGSVEHDVAASSDGVLGKIGRFFSGETSLRRSLMDHGVAETSAEAIDAAVSADGAVVVVAVDDRSDAATAIFMAHGGDVHGVAGAPGAKRLRENDSIAGQGDDLDRGTGRNASGGAGTALPGVRAAQIDRRDDRIEDGVYYERRTMETGKP